MTLAFRNVATSYVGFLILMSVQAALRADQTIADNLIVQGTLTVEDGSATIAADDAPSLFFHQTPGAFGEQMFRLGGNEGSFFLEDVDINTFPLVVEAGSPSDAIRIRSTGSVGFGTQSPAASVHVVTSAVGGSESVARFQITDDPVGRLQINNNSTSNGVFHPRIQGLATSQATPLSFEGGIDTDVGANPCISFNAVRSAGGAVANRPLVVFRNNVTVRARLAANGDFFATSFSPISTRSLKKNITQLPAETASQALRTLTPVEYVYTDDETAEPRLGFIAEDVPDLVANADRQSVPIMDVVALVTRVVKDQQQQIQDQQQTLQSQQQALVNSAATMEQQQRLIEEQRKNLEKQLQAISTLADRVNALEQRLIP